MDTTNYMAVERWEDGTIKVQSPALTLSQNQARELACWLLYKSTKSELDAQNIFHKFILAQEGEH